MPLAPWTSRRPVTPRPRAFLPAIVLLLSGSALGALDERAPLLPPLPREPSHWLGEPMSVESLRGRVTLLFVWTFG